jgi:hypothetical protein
MFQMPATAYLSKKPIFRDHLSPGTGKLIPVQLFGIPVDSARPIFGNGDSRVSTREIGIN